jgi:hypothetical protein
MADYITPDGYSPELLWGMVQKFDRRRPTADGDLPPARRSAVGGRKITKPRFIDAFGKTLPFKRKWLIPVTIRPRFAVTAVNYLTLNSLGWFTSHKASFDNRHYRE